MLTRRAAAMALAPGLAWAGVVMVAGCGKPSEPYQPTLASVDFTPRLVVEVDESGIVARRGPRDDPNVQTNPASAPQGTMVEVVNQGTADHRVRVDGLLDTGTMRPGERVTIVLSKETAADTTYVLVDAPAPTHTMALTIRPKVAASRR